MSDYPEDLSRWRLPRGRHGLPRELVERSQRERILAGVVRMTVAKGYTATTVGDILEDAGVGRETFYQLFDDKLDCTLIAHKRLLDELEERLLSVYAEGGPWPERVRKGLATTLEWFAADPEAARFTMVEATRVGPAFSKVFQTEYARFTRLLEDGISDDSVSPELPSAADLAIGAILARIYEEIVLGRASELPRLLPDLTYELLVPFVGEAAAREEQQRAAG